MGMRITKALCYFAENLEFDEQKLLEFIDDVSPKELLERVNKDDFWNKLLPDTMDSRRCSMIAQKVSQFEADRMEDLRTNIVYDTEFLMENAVGFIPFGVNDWMRRGDDIDYEEFYIKNPEHSENHVITYLDKAIWPWQDYMNKETGVVCPKYYDFKNGRKHLTDAEKAAESDVIKKYTGYKSYQEMMDSCVPTVPYDIFLLMHYSGAFKDPWKAYLSLRPAIVEWFS